jgi:predicted ATP-binding protein involved in virulence
MLEESRENGKVTFPVIAYHGTGRLWAEHEEKKVPYRMQGEGVEMAYTRCLSPKSSSKEFLSWYKTYEDEVKKFGSKTDEILLDTFKKAIISMIPDNHWTDMSYSFKDEDLIGFFKNENKTDKLLFSQLSDGYRNLIGMVADIAYRCIKLNPHLGVDAIRLTPGVVLIDELDLHLHPNWQKRIVSDLKSVFENVQFVATTHSPFIVQSLRADELINLDNVKGLDNDPNKYSVEEISENEMGVRNVKRSNEFSEMQLNAKNYFELIKNNASKEDIENAKTLLDELRIKFSNDPAYVALLESEFPKK